MYKTERNKKLMIVENKKRKNNVEKHPLIKTKKKQIVIVLILKTWFVVYMNKQFIVVRFYSFFTCWIVVQYWFWLTLRWEIDKKKNTQPKWLLSGCWIFNWSIKPYLNQFIYLWIIFLLFKWLINIENLLKLRRFSILIISMPLSNVQPKLKY